MKFYERVMVEEYMNEAFSLHMVVASHILTDIHRLKYPDDVRELYNRYKKIGSMVIGVKKDYEDIIKELKNRESIDSGTIKKLKKLFIFKPRFNEAPIAAKGWTQKSISKFEKTLGKKATEHGFFDACVARMEDKMENQAKGFCASIKDAAYGSPSWRGKDKPKSDIKKDVKDTKFAKSKQLKESTKTELEAVVKDIKSRFGLFNTNVPLYVGQDLMGKDVIYGALGNRKSANIMKKYVIGKYPKLKMEIGKGKLPQISIY